MVVSPTGEVVIEAGEDEEILNVTLDLEAVRATRALNPSLANRRM
jgi:predicted amidohydrolase